MRSMLVWSWLVAQSVAAGAADDDRRVDIVRTRWGCEIADQHLTCLLERSGSDPVALAATDPRLPETVRELRQRPASWRGRAVRIPLFTHPFDDSSVRQLAQAVLCGAAPDCDAVIGRTRWSTAANRLEFIDAHDPLLQHGQ